MHSKNNRLNQNIKAMFNIEEDSGHYQKLKKWSCCDEPFCYSMHLKISSLSENPMSRP
jgi:hypothetical protein